jgi:hypothetical protein
VSLLWTRRCLFGLYVDFSYRASFTIARVIVLCINAIFSLCLVVVGIPFMEMTQCSSGGP